VQQGFVSAGLATVSETVSKPASATTTHQNSARTALKLADNSLTRLVWAGSWFSALVMKQRFILFRRRGVFYCEDTTTRRQTSLHTKDHSEAVTLLNTRNEATRQPSMNLQIAQVYLQHSDSGLASRTWQNVMDTMAPLKTGPTQARWTAAMRDKAFEFIRSRKLIETTVEHFFVVLNSGTVSTNMFLRRLHNFAVGMHYLPWPVLQNSNGPPSSTRNAAQ
jgi:hypothetical protein